MKKHSKIGKVLGAAVLSMTTGLASAKAVTINDKAKEAIHIALDDEYKAWSLYSAILKKHGEVRPFSNIIHAEKRHQDALIGLLKTYGLPVPTNPYEDGTKDKLVAPSSVLDACKEGVQAEIDNGALYDEKIMPAVKGYADITAVMVALRDASLQRHLPAFRRCVSRDGKMGRGGRGGGGHGMGRGKGHGMGGGQGRGMGGGRGMGEHRGGGMGHGRGMGGQRSGGQGMER